MGKLKAFWAFVVLWYGKTPKWVLSAIGGFIVGALVF
jgi:hypothetical protein